VDYGQYQKYMHNLVTDGRITVEKVLSNGIIVGPAASGNSAILIME